MYSSDYAAWVYVLAWVWVVVSLALTIQWHRLPAEDWPSLRWNWPNWRRKPGCILGYVLALLAILGLLVFILLLFLSAFVYGVAATVFGDLNKMGLAVVALTGGVAGLFALIAIYSSLFVTEWR